MAGLHQAIAIVGIVVEILRRGARGIAFEAGEAMANVGGVADLAHFAVARDVDTGVGLLLHDVINGARDDGFELCGIHRLATVLREEQIDNFLRTRKTADVRRENTVCAGSHECVRCWGDVGRAIFSRRGCCRPPR